MQQAVTGGGLTATVPPKRDLVWLEYVLSVAISELSERRCGRIVHGVDENSSFLPHTVYGFKIADALQLTCIWFF